MVSNLKNVSFEMFGGSGLKLDQSFLEWIGNKLKRFAISYHQTQIPVPLDQTVFHSTLNSSSSSLKVISLCNTYLAPLIPQAHLNISHLPLVKEVKVSGNLQMVNFSTGIQYRSLKTLSLYTIERSKSDQIKYVNIQQIVKSCKALWWVEVGVETSELSDTKVEGEPAQEEEDRKIFAAPALHGLNFNLEDEIISKFYAPIDTPKLKSASVPTASSLSPSLFSLKKFK